MRLCEQCRSISSKVLPKRTVLHHNYASLQKSVFAGSCYLCSQVWDSLNEEQKGVASRSDFEGIDYEVSLGRTSYGDDGVQERILAKISFEHGEDLLYCEEYDIVGGTSLEDAGQFAILNPFGR